MKIILIEDHQAYRKSVVSEFESKGVNIGRDVIQGGLWDSSKKVLSAFTPKLGEPTVLVVDSTLNYKEKQEDGIIGNGFGLAAEWLQDLIRRYEAEGKTGETADLTRNLHVVLNPSDWRYNAGSDYELLRRICDIKGISLLESDKSKEEIVEAVLKISNFDEGKRRGERR